MRVRFVLCRCGAGVDGVVYVGTCACVGEVEMGGGRRERTCVLTDMTLFFLERLRAPNTSQSSKSLCVHVPCDENACENHGFTSTVTRSSLEIIGFQ